MTRNEAINSGTWTDPTIWSLGVEPTHHHEAFIDNFNDVTLYGTPENPITIEAEQMTIGVNGWCGMNEYVLLETSRGRIILHGNKRLQPPYKGATIVGTSGGHH